MSNYRKEDGKAKKRRQRAMCYEMYGGLCAYCGCDLPDKWHVDHIEPVKRITRMYDGKARVVSSENPENFRDDNLHPSCPSCNIQKHDLSLEKFREKIQYYLKGLNDRSTYKTAKKYGLIKETKQPVIFFFEKKDW